MRRSSGLFYAVVVTLAVFLFLPSVFVHAQTNFVKYRSGNPVLPLGPAGAWDDTEAAYAHVRFDGEQYQMWYSGSPQSGVYRIGHATSSDGINWKKHDGNPVFSTATSGFDHLDVWQPVVFFNGSQYEMWYAGNLTNGRIGYATSADALTWNRYSGNPVLTEGGSGAWDQNFVFNPVVLRSDTLYQMWYAGTNQSITGIWQTGYATSTDGMNWSKNPDNPVLEAGAPGEWDSGGAIAGSVLCEDGLYHMWYFNWSGNISGLDIGYATSPDGINWTKYQGNPILTQEPGDWDAINTNFPRVIKEGHRYRMWYTGRRSGSIDRLCYAEDFSNAAHTESIQVSPNTMVAGSGEVFFEAGIANPHDENLTAKVRVMSHDGSVNELVDLNGEDNDGHRWGIWEAPVASHDYSVKVELKNISASYVHNSDDWGVSEEFSVKQATHTFTKIADIDDDQNGEAQSVAISKGGTIFLANGSDGLRSYFFDGVSFTEIAHINDGGSAIDVAEAEDGMVFLANGDDGLRAYSYDGSSFASVSHINDGGSATDIALASDGTIFLANGVDGLRAYLFDGSSFTNTAHINDSGLDSVVALRSDGVIFVTNNDNILFAYEYDGATFKKTAQIGTGSWGDNDIAITEDGTVLVVNSDGGLRAYNYDDSSLTLVAHVNTRDWARALAIAEDGTIFLACRRSFLSSGNLYAYTFDGTSFIATAHLNAGLDTAPGSMMAANGTVFIANGENGLRAYTYSPVATSINETTSSLPMKYDLHQNYPNPFNPTTIIKYDVPLSGLVQLKIYNTLGQEIRTLVNGVQPAGSHQVIWDGRNSRGNVVPSGVYFYQLQASAMVQTRKMLLIR